MSPSSTTTEPRRHHQRRHHPGDRHTADVRHGRQHSGNGPALDQISARYLEEVGVELFGYVTAAALRLMTTCVLEPTLQVVDEGLPTIHLRAKLADAAHNANTSLH
ncbi:hypothetical protein AB9M10_15630 [Rhodococcus erythropolis]